MTDWLSQENVSNKFKQSYFIGFADISGNCIVRNGTFTVQSNCIVGNNLTVGKNITGNSELYIAGNTTLNSNLTVNQNLSCNGDISFKGAVNISQQLLMKNGNVYIFETANIGQSNYTLAPPYYQTYNITTTAPTTITLPANVSGLDGIEITFVKSGTISIDNPVTINSPAGAGNTIVAYSTVIPTNVYSMANIRTSTKFTVMNNRWYETVYTPPTEIIDAVFGNIRSTGNVNTPQVYVGNVDASFINVGNINASYINTTGAIRSYTTIEAYGNINASSIHATGEIKSNTIIADDIRTLTLSVSSFGDIVARTLTTSGRVTANSLSVSETFIVPSVQATGSITAQSFYATSDERLKTDIRPVSSQWKNIQSLCPTEYKWKSNLSYDCGFIAQQIYKVYPHMKPSSDPIYDMDYPIEGNGEPKYCTIDYSKLTPILCKGLQEVMSETESLRAEIALLKAQIRELSRV
jgi:cytoskeletal protein CcmA (bactofilin family)